MKSSGSMFHIYFFYYCFYMGTKWIRTISENGGSGIRTISATSYICRNIGNWRSREAISATGGTEIERYRHLLKYLQIISARTVLGEPYRHKTLKKIQFYNRQRDSTRRPQTVQTCANTEYRRY